MGVGISGQEGMQAVMSADFAIAQACSQGARLLIMLKLARKHASWEALQVSRRVLDASGSLSCRHTGEVFFTKVAGSYPLLHMCPPRWMSIH